MSTTPCGCQCQATETVTASEGLAFLPLRSSEPELAVSLPLFLILTMATVLKALTQQRRRPWCILRLQDTEPLPRSTALPWWRLQFSPTERRFACAVKVVLLRVSGAIAPHREPLVLAFCRHPRAGGDSQRGLPAFYAIPHRVVDRPHLKYIGQTWPQDSLCCAIR
jgi:hypothetical protein